MSRLRTRHIRSADDVRSFFDQVALEYKDQHGLPEKLLNYRLSVLRPLIGDAGAHTLLEIGCGTGIHLFPLADQFERIIGTDLSPKMIEQAKAFAAEREDAHKFTFMVDRAERLSTVSGATVDVVLCVGAFEHMIEQGEVLVQVQRVLKPAGRFVCLTPNGDYFWYQCLAKILGVETRHLSTDRFVTLPLIRAMLSRAGLGIADYRYWTFIPKGDTGPVIAALLILLDWTGQRTGLSALRGGLCFKAINTGESGF